MVRKHKRVLTSTQLAGNSASQRCISARFRIMEAQGVAERMRMLALKERGSGRGSTAR